MDGSAAASLGSVVAAIVAAGAAIATQRSASSANLKASETDSRSTIEKDAYLNAERFWKGVVEEQEAQIAALKVELAAERASRIMVETDLRARLSATEVETHSCRVDLDAAKAVIRRLRQPTADADPDLAGDAP